MKRTWYKKRTLWILLFSKIHMLFAFDITANKLLTLVHIRFWNIGSPAGPPFSCAMKGDRPMQRGEKVVIGQTGDSFQRMLDREAAARMSGRQHMSPIT